MRLKLEIDLRQVDTNQFSTVAYVWHERSIVASLTLAEYEPRAVAECLLRIRVENAAKFAAVFAGGCSSFDVVTTKPAQEVPA